MGMILLAIGLVCVVEGLVLALAPSRIEDVLRAFAEMPPESRRMLGLGALGVGVVLIWIARLLGT